MLLGGEIILRIKLTVRPEKCISIPGKEKSRSVLKSKYLPVEGLWWGKLFSPGVKQPERAADHAPASSANVFRFLVRKRPDRFRSPNIFLFKRYCGGSFLSPGVKQPEREADHAPASSAEVKNDWSYICSLPRSCHEARSDLTVRIKYACFPNFIRSQNTFKTPYFSFYISSF